MIQIFSLRLFCVLLCLFYTGITYSQNEQEQGKLEEFLQELDTIASAEGKILACTKFAYKNRFQKFIYPLTAKSRQIALDSKSELNYALSLEFTANYHQYNTNLDSAKWYYQRALDRDIPEFRTASIMTGYGGIFSKEGNMPKAIELSLAAKQLYENAAGTLAGKEEVVRQGQYGILLNSMANAYLKIENFDEANTYYDQAISQFINLKDTIAAGIILANKGQMLNTLERYDEALADLKESRVLKEIGNASKSSIAMSSYHIAESYAGLSRYDEARKLYESVIVEFESLEDDFGRATSYTNFGKMLLKEGFAIHEAYSNCKKGNKYALNAGLLDIQSYSFECLYETLKLLGKNAEALTMYEEFVSRKDSLINDKNTKLITQMEMQYTYDQEQAKKLIIENERARKSKLIIAALSGIIFSLFFISYLIYKSLVQKRESATILSQKNSIITSALREKDILLREIHHRVKNNLQVISSLLSLQTRYTDDPNIALAIKSGKDRVKSMTLIHQNLYQRENLTGIDVDSYFDKLVKSLFHSYNISKDRIHLETDIASLNLDVDTAVPLGLIANELITNALKYAFPNQQEGLISVKLEEKEGKLIFSVKDNGTGFQKPDTPKTDGFGLELVDAFKAKLDAEVKICSDNGTMVELIINDFKKADPSKILEPEIKKG